MAQEEHDHCGDEDDGQVVIPRLLGCSSLSQFVWRRERCRRKEKMETNKPVVELLLTVFLPSSRRQRRLLKLLRVIWDARHKWEGYKWWQRVCVSFWICVFSCLIIEMWVRRKGFTWREFSSWGKSRSPEESTLRFLVSTKCKYNSYQMKRKIQGK